MDFRSQMSVLIQLSLIDNELSQKEKRMVYTLGKANKMPEKEIEEILSHHLRNARHELPNLANLSDDDKFEYLFNIVQLMKVDKHIYLSEIRFCEELAKKLGYKKSVVSEMSAKIFSDSAVAADRELLRSIVAKHRAK